MAKFIFNGVDTISAKFEELARLTDEEKMSIIRPSAELLLERQRKKLLETFRKFTGDLSNALTISKRKGPDGPYMHIYFKGEHRSSSTGKRKHRHPNGPYSGTNAEIAYILEFGSPRIPASHWMEEVEDETVDELAAIQQTAWDELLTKKGL